MATHRYWRIYCSNGWASTTSVTIGSVIMKAAPGGSNLSVTGNGTALASSQAAGYEAAKAFLGDETPGISSQWYNGSITYPQWLRWDFGAGNEQWIGELTLWCPASTVGGYVKDFLIQYSDDGTTWSTATSGTTASNTASTSTTFLVPEPIAVTVASTLPRLSMSALGGSAATALLPALSIQSATGANPAITLPSLTATSTAHDATGDYAAEITLPILSAAITTGAHTAAALPSLSASAAATTAIFASAPLELPSLSAASAATVPSMTDAAITLPSITSAASAGAVCSITIGSLTTLATGTTGSLGRAQVTLPMFEATATATAENYGGAAITLPSLSMDTGAVANITLPGFTLTAIGSAVVTATYEAYAINLNHTPRRGVEPVDEATRYTSFPFTHVIRHKGSYYGANSTGLYLLEGTTDDAAPITWAMKTALTDFDSIQRKTVASAYFGGRLGPASTVTLHAGEGAETQAYAYTTPRGALAQNYRQAFGKGIKQHRYYALAATGDGEMALDNVDLDVHNMTRRI